MYMCFRAALQGLSSLFVVVVRIRGSSHQLIFILYVNRTTGGGGGSLSPWLLPRGCKGARENGKKKKKKKKDGERACMTVVEL